MYPVAGAGDYLGDVFPVGAGDSLSLPYNIGPGAGGYLPELSFALDVLSNVIIRQTNCRILSLSPMEPSSDRAFVIEHDDDLCLTTPLTPGGSYAASLMLVDAETGGDISLSDTVIFVPPAVVDTEGNIVASRMPKQFYLLESLTFAIGKVVQSLGGRPSCRVASDCNIGDSILLVNSTLGFPRQGFLIIDGSSVAYSDKCDTAFLLSSQLLHPLPAGDVVISDVKSIPPRRAQ